MPPTGKQRVPSLVFDLEAPGTLWEKSHQRITRLGLCFGEVKPGLAQGLLRSRGPEEEGKGVQEQVLQAEEQHLPKGFFFLAPLPP